ncbi:hypothetical protein RUM44_006407 [Polyplax serrata]|uniref:Uncharacterized protein n=1 Tax=Polyplax serrata TaxID=468196 RepID=A0ABR1AJJ2_POLSC
MATSAPRLPGPGFYLLPTTVTAPPALGFGFFSATLHVRIHTDSLMKNPPARGMGKVEVKREVETRSQVTSGNSYQNIARSIPTEAHSKCQDRYLGTSGRDEKIGRSRT